MLAENVDKKVQTNPKYRAEFVMRFGRKHVSFHSNPRHSWLNACLYLYELYIKFRQAYNIRHANHKKMDPGFMQVSTNLEIQDVRTNTNNLENFSMKMCEPET
jgi:hypothetical protein